jgi:hypothetical protein
MPCPSHPYDLIVVIRINGMDNEKGRFQKRGETEEGRRETTLFTKIGGCGKHSGCW